MESLVSVVVPIYGVEQYVEQCIKSIIDQTYKNLDIILVDDGSKDRCPQICDRYADLDKRIRVIHKENGGAANARKVGMSYIRGKYVLFVDGDDWIEPDMISKMLQKQEEHKADIVICSFTRDSEENSTYEKIFFKDGSYDKHLLKTQIYPQMLYTGSFGIFGIMPSLCAKLFKSSLLKEAIVEAPDQVSLGDDATVLYPMMLQAERCYIISNNFYHYRVNENSMTLSYNRTQTLDTINLINYLRKKLIKYKEYNMEEQIDAYHLFITIRNIVNISEAGFGKGYGKRIKDLEKYLEKTSFYSILGHSHIKKVDAGKKIKLGIFLLKLHYPGILVFLYCASKLKSNKIIS